VEGIKVGILYNVPHGNYKNADDFISEKGVLEEVEALCRVMEDEGFVYELLPIENPIKKTLDMIEQFRPQVVFNLAEGINGNSGKEMLLPALLELLNIPYTGSPALSLGLCLDKVKTKALLKTAGLNTPRYIVAMNVDAEPGDLHFPLIVKPVCEDSSLGISKQSLVYNKAQLGEQIRRIRCDYSQPALVEEYIDGREFNISVMGNNPCRVLPISELDFCGLAPESPKICGYEAKWIAQAEENKAIKVVCPAELSDHLVQRVQEVALIAYNIMGCRDYARIDVRMDDEEKIYVLEVNPNPDISPCAGLARSVQKAGLSYNNFIKDVLTYAWNRRDHN
jgi:D-alanine-D-alanine ligase